MSFFPAGETTALPISLTGFERTLRGAEKSYKRKGREGKRRKKGTEWTG